MQPQLKNSIQQRADTEAEKWLFRLKDGLPAHYSALQFGVSVSPSLAPGVPLVKRVGRSWKGPFRNVKYSPTYLRRMHERGMMCHILRNTAFLAAPQDL